MTAKTSTALTADVTTTLADNTTGAITATILRQRLLDFIDSTQNIAARGVANGYAPLDASGFVPSANLKPVGATSVSIGDLGAVMDGTTDDTAVIAAGFAAGNTKLVVPAGKKVRIATSLTIPEGCTLEGANPNWSYSAGAGGWIGTMGNALIVSRNISILLANGATLRGFLIRPPDVTTTDLARASADAWTGTAVSSAYGNSSDQLVENCTIAGFAVGAAFNGSRVRLRRLFIDCTNGVRITNSSDICYVDQVHCWPMCSVNRAGYAQPDLCRSGVGIYLGTPNDWPIVTNCFTYGYGYGFQLEGCSFPRLIGCASDYNNGVTSKTNSGVYISGATVGALIEGMKISSCQDGITVNAAPPTLSPRQPSVTIRDTHISAIDSVGINVVQGNARIVGASLSNTSDATIPTGIQVTSGANHVTIQNIEANYVSTFIGLSGSFAGRLRDKGGHVLNNITGYCNLIPVVIPTLTPAGGAISLNGEDTMFFVNAGTVNDFGNPYPYVGKIITLISKGAVTYNHGAGIYLTTGTGTSIVTDNNDVTQWVANYNGSTVLFFCLGKTAFP